MAVEDLADQIDDYICVFEGVGDLMMDTLAMFVFIVCCCVLILLYLGKFLYNKYVKKTDTVPADTKPVALAATLAPPAIVTADKLRSSEPRELLEKKVVKQDIRTTPARGDFKSFGGSGNIAGATPQMRKRLSRRSPGPELRKSKTIQPPSNVTGPDTTFVTWTSQLFMWLYSDLVVVNEVIHGWLLTINDTMRNSLDDQGMMIEIIRMLPESPPPTITNIYCDQLNTMNDVAITCDMDCTPVLQVKVFRQIGEKVETYHYKVTLARFKGRLNFTMNFIELRGEMRIEGYPDIRIAINSVGPIKNMGQDETQQQTLITDLLTSSIRECIYPVDFSIYASCPRALVMEAPPSTAPYGYESQMANMQYNDHYAPMSHMTMMPSTPTGKRLLVKIVKGEGILGAVSPYCVVEMDEPPQKNQTGIRRGVNVMWDEPFLFDLNQNSAELLFECYDKSKMIENEPKFLGLGLVGIDELLSVGIASSQVLSLQSRPYEENEVVYGSITVEFVFIESAQIPVGRQSLKLKDTLKIDKTQSQSPMQSVNVIETVVNKDTFNNNPRISPVTTVSPIRKINNENLLSPNSPHMKNSTFNSHTNNANQFDESHHVTNGLHTLDTHNQQLKFDISPSAPLSPSRAKANTFIASDGSESERTTTQDKDKKRKEFFGSIKRRLARSRDKSKNGMEPVEGNGMLVEDSDRNHGRSALNHSNLSRRSSMSESSAVSGLSTASSKTYVHEASTLVLETTENSVKRHYLVPLAIAQRPRWRRKGIKLHIYNDHTFIAKHLSGGLICEVCNRSIPRRPGKQGYECRDCLMKCHKPCHVRTAQVCSNPTILSIELSNLPVLIEN